MDRTGADETDADTIDVQVWSDVVCPWCAIGRHRFLDGVRRFQETTPGAPRVRVTYRSFMLSPETPTRSDAPVAEFLAAHRGLPAAQVEQMLAQVTALAAEEGLGFRLDRARHTGTSAAHEVIHLAAARGRQAEMVDRLFRAHLEEGRHVGDVEELAALGADVGLDPQEVRTALADARYRGDVEADVEQARAYGITGVPFHVVDGRYGVSGAQSAETFAEALRRAAAERVGA